MHPFLPLQSKAVIEVRQSEFNGEASVASEPILHLTYGPAKKYK
jgi:hypothetical protein